MNLEDDFELQNLSDMITQMNEIYKHNIAVIPNYINEWWEKVASDKEKCREIDRVCSGEREPSGAMWNDVTNLMKNRGELDCDCVIDIYDAFSSGIAAQQSKISERQRLGIPYDESIIDIIGKLMRRFKYVSTRKVRERSKVIIDSYLNTVRGKKKPKVTNIAHDPSIEEDEDIDALLDKLVDDLNEGNIKPKHGREFIKQANKLPDPKPGMIETFNELIRSIEVQELEKAEEMTGWREFSNLAAEMMEE